MIILTYKTVTQNSGPNALGCLYDAHELRASVDRTQHIVPMQELRALKNIQVMMQETVIEEDGFQKYDILNGEYSKRNSTVFTHHQISELAVGLYAENRRDADKKISASRLRQIHFCQLIGRIISTHPNMVEVDNTVASVVRCETPSLYPHLPLGRTTTSIPDSALKS